MVWFSSQHPQDKCELLVFVEGNGKIENRRCRGNRGNNLGMSSLHLMMVLSVMLG